MIYEIDVHGCSVAEAKTMITRALKTMNKDVRVLRVVHGYHNGQKIAAMVRRNFRSHPKIERIELSMNPGITDLIIRRKL